MKTALAHTTLFGWALFCASGLFWNDQAHAQDGNWAGRMFDEHEHDFGVVARGTAAKHRLKVTNRYSDTVHIAKVTTTCGCTAAIPEKETLARNESTYVEITMNTVKFEGHKPSSVTVIFDRPAHAEVRIPIHAFIRKDIVLTPGGAQFGTITSGQSAERTISIAYAGRGDWKIKNVVNKDPNVDVQFAETRRDAGRVDYELHVTVKEGAPVGEFREQVTLVTDESANPFVPLLVEGRIESEYAVSPEIVSLGNLTPGEQKTVNIVIHGQKPFLVERIESQKSGGVFEVRLPKDPKRIQIVPLTVIAPDDLGPLAEDFWVSISGSTQSLKFKAHAKIISAQ